MTISSSLAAGVAGLNANATRLASISDNLANSSTFGFRRSVVDFNSLVVDGSGSRFAAGGVRASAQRVMDESGALVASGNPTDLAIAGGGFLPVVDSATLATGVQPLPLSLTTTGAFRPDADGILRTGDGRVLLGWPADQNGQIPNFPRDTTAGLEPVRLDTGQLVASPTTEIALAANLPADATQAGAAGAPIDLPLQYFDTLGAQQTLIATFTPQVPAAGASNIWTLTITDPAAGGAVVGDYEITFSTAQPGGGSIANVLTNTGQPYDPVTGRVGVAVAAGPIEIGIGPLGAGTGLTQFADPFRTVSISRDGTPPGSLTGVRVGSDGVVNAIFDTGFSRPVFQIPLVSVPNPNGLVPLGNQGFGLSNTSGDFLLRDAGDGSVGDLVGFALEESTTDIATELTSLIQTQRAYSSNASVVRTVDEILQETANLKR